MSEPRKYLSENTQNVAGVHVITRASCAPEWQRNDADILFTFVIQGSMALECEGRAPYDLQAGDAFVIPPGMKTRYAAPYENIELLEVSLPGSFQTVSTSTASALSS
jgi:quercetin dioxygenase-like cupin family protein